MELDVVVVSYRCRELLRDCLGSLRRYPASTGTRVWVVDNDSRDGTAEMVSREFPEIGLQLSPGNVGFAAATNRGIRCGAAPYVLALNPDTRVTAGALDRMLELEDGSLDHACRRSFPTPLGALAHFARIGRRDDAPDWLAQYRAPAVERGPVDAVNGAFMLIRRSALEQVGLFDEGFWMYMEDLDLCFRFAEAGWVTWYEPSVSVVHIKAGTSGRWRRPRLNVAFHYGMWRFYRKHYASKRHRVVNLAVYLGIGVKLGLSLVSSAVRRRISALAA